MAWIKYEGSLGRKLVSKISITKSGYLTLSTQFFAENGLEQYKYVMLYYSPEDRKIGLRFNNEENDKGNLKVHTNKNGRGGGLVAKGFFKQNNLNHELLQGKYDPVKEIVEGIGELYIIDLKSRETASA